MQAQLKNLTEQFEEIVGTVRTRIVDTNEYVADTVSPYINSLTENVSKTADSVTEQVSGQFNKTVDGIELPKIVDSTVSFVSNGVEANRKFVAELVNAWTPVTDEPTKAASPKAASPKATAKKAPAKKKPATKKAAPKKTAAKASAKK